MFDILDVHFLFRRRPRRFTFGVRAEVFACQCAASLGVAVNLVLLGEQFGGTSPGRFVAGGGHQVELSEGERSGVDTEDAGELPDPFLNPFAEASVITCCASSSVLIWSSIV